MRRILCAKKERLGEEVRGGMKGGRDGERRMDNKRRLNVAL